MNVSSHRLAIILMVLLQALRVASASELSICSRLKHDLIRQTLNQGSEDGVNTQVLQDDRVVGHWVKFTKFCFDCQREQYVLGSGFALFKNPRLHVQQSDLFVAESNYFLNGEWRESQRLSNIDRSASMQNDLGLKALSTAIFYLKYGKAGDKFYRTTGGGTNIDVHMPSYGIRGSDIRYWYACQSCRRDVPTFTHDLSQDIRFTRLALHNSKLVVVTTRPRVVLAILEGSKIEYQECSESYRDEIERTSTYED